MERIVNATNTLSIENVIRTFGAALDTLGDLVGTGIIDEEIIFDAFPVISNALRDVLDNKLLAYVVDDCLEDGTPTKYSVFIFDDSDDCHYFLDGVNSECREITVDEFEELSPYEWDNLNKYKKTVDGTMVFHDFAD